MEHLLTERPKEGAEFCKEEIYPPFATFAAFYGAANETKGWVQVAKLKDGNPLLKIMCIYDVAFLFLVYIAFCGHIDDMTKERGWYFCDEATTMVKHIASWMADEDKDESSQEEAQKAIQTFLDPLSDVLDAIVDVDDNDDGDSDGGSSSDDSQ
jgi:hypothetical protein